MALVLDQISSPLDLDLALITPQGLYLVLVTTPLDLALTIHQDLALVTSPLDLDLVTSPLDLDLVTIPQDPHLIITQDQDLVTSHQGLDQALAFEYFSKNH